MADKDDVRRSNRRASTVPRTSPEHDDVRLTGQLLRVFALMQDGHWRTLDEIATVTGDPPASISAQLRHLRKRRFGSHVVERQARGERTHGLWEYRIASEPVERRARGDHGHGLWEYRVISSGDGGRDLAGSGTAWQGRARPGLA